MSAIESYKRIGVTRSLVHHFCINFFHYPPHYTDTLSDYFILHWEGAHVIDQINDGVITHNNKQFLVVYQHCTPFNVMKTKFPVRLSFRKPIADFNIPAYVIVRLHNE